MNTNKNSASSEATVSATTTTEGVNNNIHNFEFGCIDCSYNEETQTLTVGNSICVSGVSKDKVSEAVSNLLTISNTYGYICGDYEDVLSNCSDELSAIQIADKIDEYLDTLTEEEFKDIVCNNEILMGWGYFSEDEKKFLLEHKEIGKVMPCRMVNIALNQYELNYGASHIDVYREGLRIYFDR